MPLRLTPLIAASLLLACASASSGPGAQDTAATPLPVSPAAEQRAPRSRAEITLSFAPVVRRAAPAVVTVYTRKRVTARRHPFAGDPFFEQFFGELFGRSPTRERVRTSLGSGVIVDPSGIIVSNHHVIAGADEITVVLGDKREFEGQVIFADRESDLAVIELAGAAGLPSLELRDSDTLEVGDLVLAIGNPFGVGQTVTSGIVSGLARSVPGREGQGYLVQTDAAINPGNSGGALVDMGGRLVGVPTSILSRSGGSNGIGFAVPANLVRRVIAAARAGEQELNRPWLGLAAQPVDGALAEALGLPRPRGVLVDDLHPESRFAAAGLAAGDVILTFAGAEVESPEALAFRAATLGTGTTAEIDFLRDGRERSAEVELAPAPERPPRARKTLRSGLLAGLTVEAVNPAVIEERGLPLRTRGVQVVGVEGLARRSGLRPGDVVLKVDERAVPTVDVFEAALGRAGASLALEVLRGDRRGTIAIRG